MNKLDLDYQALLQDILDNGITRMDRTGTGSLSVFVRTIRHKMSDGFPLLTTKRVPFKMIATELLWFLKGDTNIKYLVENNCNIWTGDAYKRYVTEHKKNFETPELSKDEFSEMIEEDAGFAEKWGEMGPIYGAQWRGWGQTDSGYDGVDQIGKLINDLKTNPDSRRLIVNAWNVAEIPNMVLPPCHYGFECYTRELTYDQRLNIYYNWHRIMGMPSVAYSGGFSGDTSKSEMLKFLDSKDIPKRALSLKFNIRSNDVPLGLPFNIASYGLLLLLIAKQVNMIPDELVYVGTDVHIYLDQIEGAKEQIGREFTIVERIKQIMDSGQYESFDQDWIKEKADHDIKIQEAILNRYSAPRRTREPYPLPTVTISDRPVNDISEYTLDDITLHNYVSHSKIYFPLSN